MLLHIHHTTTYRYDLPVYYALLKAHLRPQHVHSQQVNAWELDVSGGLIESQYTDQYGNHVDLINVDRDATEVTITAHGSVMTSDNSGVFGRVYGRAPLWHFLQETPITTSCDAIVDLAGPLSSNTDQIAALHQLSADVLEALPYKIGATHSETTVEEAMGIGAGVCQDHAHVFVTVARTVGIPARYVSGYLMMNDRVDQDATHAWAEAHVDGIGWIGFDVSNAMCPDERYVRVAVGRDVRDAAPTEGLRLGDASEHLVVSLQVQQ